MGSCLNCFKRERVETVNKEIVYQGNNPEDVYYCKTK